MVNAPVLEGEPFWISRLSSIRSVLEVIEGIVMLWKMIQADEKLDLQMVPGH